MSRFSSGGFGDGGGDGGGDSSFDPGSGEGGGDYIDASNGRHESGEFGRPSEEHSWMPALAGLGVGVAAGALASSAWYSHSTQDYPQPPAQPTASTPPWGGPPRRWGSSLRPRSPTSCSCWPVVNILVVVVALYIRFGVYGGHTMEVGAHDSRLFHVLPLFCQTIKFSSSGSPADIAPAVYTAYTPPPLSQLDAWTETHSVVVRSYGYDDWVFWLNEGSSVRVEYDVMGRDRVTAMVLRGQNRFKEWRNDPHNFQDYEQKRDIRGVGSFQFIAAAKGDYHISLGNFRRSAVQVSLAFSIAGRVYDLTGARAVCPLSLPGGCTVELDPSQDVYAVVAPSSSRKMSHTWQIDVQYGPRWPAYLLLIGGTWLLSFIFSTISLCARRRSPCPSPTAAATDPNQWGPAPAYPATDQTPLLGPALPQPEWPASQPPAYGATQYPSVFGSEGPPRLQTWSAEQSGVMPAWPAAPPPPPPGGLPTPSAPPMDVAYGPKQVSAAQSEDNTCAVCFDSSKDAVFYPCGHRATCYPCGLRLSRGPSPVCPICRAKIDQVIKVYDS